MKIAAMNMHDRKNLEGSPADPLDPLAGALFHAMGADGVYARTALYESVIQGLSALIDTHREDGCEVMRFPPVMSRAILERSGYLDSFPNLLGCVCGLHGSERDVLQTVADFKAGKQDWTEHTTASELVLSPAACYPLYPIVAERGDLPPEAVSSTCSPTASAPNPPVTSTGCSRSACANTSASAPRRTSPRSASAGSSAPRASP